MSLSDAYLYIGLKCSRVFCVWDNTATSCVVSIVDKFDFRTVTNGTSKKWRPRARSWSVNKLALLTGLHVVPVRPTPGALRYSGHSAGQSHSAIDNSVKHACYFTAALHVFADARVLLYSSVTRIRGRTRVTLLSLRHLTTGIRSEKCVVRRFRRCANVIERFSFCNLATVLIYI
jgi:hypothetical protein